MQTVETYSRVAPAIIMAGLTISTLAACWLAYGPLGDAALEPGAGPVTVAGAPEIGGPFTLRDDSGRVVTEATLANGKYHLIFFGFAQCPDVCPGMLQLMAGVEENLSPAVREALQFVFVSVDPKRDSLEKLGDYVRSFSPSFVGWTGEQSEIDRMVKGYLAYYAIRPADKGAAPEDYTVDHSGFAYLMGPNGKYITHFRSSDSASSLQNGLEAAVQLSAAKGRSGR